MQLGLVRRLAVALSVFVVLMVSGCGQKGPLYRNAPVPDAVPCRLVTPRQLRRRAKMPMRTMNSPEPDHPTLSFQEQHGSLQLP